MTTTSAERCRGCGQEFTDPARYWLSREPNDGPYHARCLPQTQPTWGAWAPGGPVT